MFRALKEYKPLVDSIPWQQMCSALHLPKQRNALSSRNDSQPLTDEMCGIMRAYTRACNRHDSPVRVPKACGKPSHDLWSVFVVDWQMQNGGYLLLDPEYILQHVIAEEKVFLKFICSSSKLQHILTAIFAAEFPFSSILLIYSCKKLLIVYLCYRCEYFVFMFSFFI